MSFFGNSYITTVSDNGGGETSITYFSDKTTGSAAMAKQLTCAEAWFVKEVRIHLSDVGGAGTLQILINAVGAEYDLICMTQDMTTITDYYWQPDKSIPLLATDTFDIVWDNTNSRTYGIEIIYYHASDVEVYLSDKTTGSAAISKSLTSIEPNWSIVEIRLHLSAAGGSGNFTCIINATGSIYDTICFSQDMTDITDLHWQPDNPIQLTSAESFDISWANASLRTYGLEIIYKTN
jgi:hypothetical protein